MFVRKYTCKLHLSLKIYKCKLHFEIRFQINPAIFQLDNNKWFESELYYGWYCCQDCVVEKSSSHLKIDKVVWLFQEFYQIFSKFRVRISWKLNNCSHLYPSREGLRVDIAAVARHHRRAWDKYLGSVFRLISIGIYRRTLPRRFAYSRACEYSWRERAGWNGYATLRAWTKREKGGLRRT